ncbi:hypothetical protein GYA28_02850 [Candidatus Roizmanbacteria bacterium]|jgi:elongation factor P hydroxylase|nr:hypothetical protein [Candidatus Roizmanbacteria bacterium]
MKKILRYWQKEIKKHAFDYLLLIFSGVLFLVALSYFQGERTTDFLIFLSFVFFYIGWGVYHHAFKNSLRLKIVLEYILFGFIALYLLKIIFI